MVKVGTITFKYLTNADIDKLPWLISGELDNNVIWRFVPKELRGEEFDSRSKQFYAEVKSVKDNLRAYCVTQTVLPLVIFWITQDENKWAQQSDRRIKDPNRRASWRLQRIREEESVVFWWLTKFESILNLRYIFCMLDPSSAREKLRKENMRARLRGKLVLTCDAVYRFHPKVNRPYSRVAKCIVCSCSCMESRRGSRKSMGGDQNQ
jgi:hypothetical protein